MVDISSHNNLISGCSTGKLYCWPLRDKRHVTRREIDIGASELSIDFEDDVGAVLAFGVCNVFHLQVT